ncbi:MAG: isoprenylcysteine carboxylmethyltransferase family protein [Ignavibacteriaceae bacterium]|nr:isoprenylcysteine carboxylmethyltransferase family protein [Ignavibacteriaceae bacterium]
MLLKDFTMDPINIIIGLNIIATFGANISGAKKGLRSALSEAKEKPKTYLQKIPLAVSTVTLVVLILALFQIGTLEYKEEYFTLRLIGLAVYLFFSWVQIWAYKSLGESYSQEIIIFKKHALVKKGPFKFIRHPQYFSQILVDLGGSIAVLSFLLLPLVFIEIPILILRALLEEKILQRHFGEQFTEYKKHSGFFIPFLG